MPKQRVAKAWQADCLSLGKAMHCSWHAKTKGGQGIPKLGVGKVSSGNAMHCSEHAKTKGGQGMTQGMPKQRVAKAWQVDCLLPGKAMHCSRHSNTKGGQGMSHDMTK
ncbi:hypothetical protein RHGRI_001415 [Rhododendron griersonianum]|uniref:Uncharacterized protein n=1 Tax=Rhododendron griersonianum TaxID=479676 RepID=A0AAV6LNZ8_9ERIC|nr:hypothetical protein RHGRI_001415 [Rhododendron griersonianum]